MIGGIPHFNSFPEAVIVVILEPGCIFYSAEILFFFFFFLFDLRGSVISVAYLCEYHSLWTIHWYNIERNPHTQPGF